jgi:hypothetical protein
MTGSDTKSEGAVFPRRAFVSGSSKEPRRTDLIAEAERYLSTVELFRSEGREPQWLVEPRRCSSSIDAVVTRPGARPVR